MDRQTVDRRTGDHQLDWAREARTGVPEAVFCQGKTPGQIGAILDTAAQAGRRLLLTRLDAAGCAALPDGWAARLDYEPLSATAIFGGPAATASPGVAVIAAGTSDLAVAGEAARTLAFNGFAAPVIADVGVAGLWRLLDRLEEIRAHKVLIAVAGMEGALFSVLAGLVAAPVIAVPTSVGYGVAANGAAAFIAALASCAPGVLTVNIDNGFGAAAAAVKILRHAHAAPPPPPPQNA